MRPSVLIMKWILRTRPLFVLIMALIFVGCANEGATRIQSDRGLYGKNKVKPGSKLDQSRDDNDVLFDDDDRKDDDLFDRDDRDDDRDDRDDRRDDEDDEEEETEQLEFPSLGFATRGHSTYKNKDRLPMTSALQIDLDEDYLQIAQSGTQIQCGDVSGCERKHVEPKAQKLNGTDKFTRTSTDDRRDAGSKYRQARYAIFADRVQKKDGKVFEFSKPLPVYPWPAPQSRFEDLDGEDQVFEATVTVSDWVPNGRDVDLDEFDKRKDDYARSGRATREFPVKVTVSLVRASEDEVVVSLQTDLPSDHERMLYGSFPLTRKTTYTIDPDERVVTHVDMEGWFHGSRSKRGEQTVLKVNLCSREDSKGVDSFPCQ